MGEGLGGGDAAQLVGDRLMQAVAATRSCWPPSIFHDQPGLVAHKIGNLATDLHLAAELVSLYLMRAQHLPEPPFRFGHALA